MMVAELFYDKSRSIKRYGREIGEPWIYNNGVDAYTHNYKSSLSTQAYRDLRHMKTDKLKEYNQRGELISTTYSDAVRIPETQKLLNKIKYLEKENERIKERNSDIFKENIYNYEYRRRLEIKIRAMEILIGEAKCLMD